MYTESSTYESLLTPEGWYAIPVYRCAVVRESEQAASVAQIRSPLDVQALMGYRMKDYDREHAEVIFLDTKNNVIGINVTAVGSLSECHVDMRNVFKAAIILNAASIIFVHNHPSGDPTPSPEDVRITEMMIEAGKVLMISVMDHVVIGNGKFVSLKERGLGFH